MKNLSNAVKNAILGIISVIVAAIAFIFGEKRSINKHQKVTGYAYKHNVDKNYKTDDGYIDSLLSCYFSKYAQKFGVKNSKHNIKKFLSASETSIPLVENYIFSDYCHKAINIIEVYEFNENDSVLVGVLSVEKNRAFVLIYSFNQSTYLTVISSKANKKSSGSMLIKLQKLMNITY